MGDTTSRFDWYSATLENLDDLRVAQNLAISLRGVVTFRKGLHGYSRGWSIERGKEKLVNVFGGSSREGEVHVQASSESCDEVVPLLRKLWPEHRVSRVDSAVDFFGDFDQLRAYAKSFAKERGLAWNEVTNSDGGATIYIGSRNSERFFRLYKKSEQLRALHPERASEIPAGVLRAELELKPSKREAKERVAVMSAEDIWGLSKWTKDLAESLLSLAPERTKLRFSQTSDWNRSLHYLGLQYAPMIAKRLQTHAPEDVFEELFEALGIDGLATPIGVADDS